MHFNDRQLLFIATVHRYWT